MSEKAEALQSEWKRINAQMMEPFWSPSQAPDASLRSIWGLGIPLQRHRRCRKGDQSSLRFEQDNAGGKAMHKVLSANWTELACCKEARDGDRSQRLLNQARVMIWLGKQPGAASIAGEQQPATRLGFGIIPHLSQHRPHFAVGRAWSRT